LPALIFFHLAALLNGQPASAVLRGVVKGARGVPIPAARVVAHDVAANADHETLSGPDGSFLFGHINAGHYLLTAGKPGIPNSPTVAVDLAAGETSQVELLLTAAVPGPPAGFLKRLYQAYSDDWHGTTPGGPDPPRRAPPSPLNSPPFPNSDWSYGGAPVIGVPDTNVPPLMQALYAGPHGKAWEDSRIKVYGWLEPSFNLSTSQHSNAPSAYDISANRIEFDQAVLYVERIPDSVQTTQVDWGFHLSGLYGASYRFTTNEGYFSQQLLNQHRQYGFDPVLEYFDLYIPQVADGLNIRVGRFISVPGIEAQLAPNNYVYTHSLLYSIDPFTDTGIIGTLKLNNRWLVQFGLSAGHDVAPWATGAQPSGTACVSYTSTPGNDNFYACANGLNKGEYAYNNLQMFDNTWYHKFNASWHMATEAWYMYQKDVPSVFGSIKPIKGTNGAFCAAGQTRCFAPEWAAVNYVERQFSARNYISVRSDFLDDEKGQRTGFKTRYTEATLMWGHWVGTTVLLRPELRFDHAFDATAYDNGTRRNQFQFAMDAIFKF
jgi:Putative beta-barrel porin-2, OmpL-like. bbp2/Carboxypeptidase regulatory-like domain